MKKIIEVSLLILVLLALVCFKNIDFETGRLAAICLLFLTAIFYFLFTFKKQEGLSFTIHIVSHFILVLACFGVLFNVMGYVGAQVISLIGTILILLLLCYSAFMYNYSPSQSELYKYWVARSAFYFLLLTFSVVILR